MSCDKQLSVLTRTVLMYARLTKRQYRIVDTLSYLSKNLYNVGLYNARQHYHNIQLAGLESLRPDLIAPWMGTKKTYLPYSRGKTHPDKDYSNYNLSKTNENYGLLHSQAAQQTLGSLDKAYTSYFELKKKTRNGEQSGSVGLPGYLDIENGRYKVTYPRNGLTVKGNKVTLGMSSKFRKQNKLTGKELTFKIPALIKPDQVREVALLPVRGGKCYKIGFTYQIKEKKNVELDRTKYLGIDLGVNNFATMVDNATGTAVIIDGKYLKSLNWWYNKTNARLQSVKSKQGIVKLTRRQHNLLVRRDCRINEAMNRYVDWIIKHAVKKRIGNIVCLSWNGIKQKKRGQSNFVQIPFDKFRTKLESKCELYGIKYHGKESEAYTSVTDALAFDKIGDHWYKDARRIERGLYQSITGHLINADINGAINQIRKVAGDSPAKEIVSIGRFNRPVRIRLSYEITNFGKIIGTECVVQPDNLSFNPPVLTGGS